MSQSKGPASEGDDPISKALALGSYFLSGCLAINVSQVLGAPLSLINSEWYNSWIAFTKQQFAVLTMTMTQRWAPTVVCVSGDASVRGQLFQTTSEDLLCLFPKRMVMMANHQIYTDWLYLWWIAYSNGMHGHIYIVLKESLKRIPVIGWGMQLSQFIFLKRNWQQDKPQMASHLKKLDRIQDPMWLLLFPEGTNLAPSTRAASASWAAKTGIRDLQHTLLPRTTGLQFCLQELHQTISYVYDCTIAYEGVPRGQYAQDVYTLQASYIGGKPPKCVHMYWRRFPVSQIPLYDDRRFELWLRARWMEKDSLIEYFYKHGRFPADTGRHTGPDGRVKQGAGYVNATIKASKWNDFLHQFMPMGLLAMILFTFYGALPEVMQESLKQHPLLKNISALPQVHVQDEQAKQSQTVTPTKVAAVAPGATIMPKSTKMAQAMATQKKHHPPKPAPKLPPKEAHLDSSKSTASTSVEQSQARKLAQIQRSGNAPKLALKLPNQEPQASSVISAISVRSGTSARSAPSVRSVQSNASIKSSQSVQSIASAQSSKLSSVTSSVPGSKQTHPRKLGPRRSMPSLDSMPSSNAESVSSTPIASGVLPKLGPRNKPETSATPLRSAMKGSRSNSIAGLGAEAAKSPTRRVQIVETPRLKSYV